MKNIYLSLLALLSFSSYAIAQQIASNEVDKKDQRPNIVLIMADDLGFSDIGCYGGEIHTPNIDALAAGGMRFKNFYNTSRCCPTRASLLTGLYNQQAGIGEMTTDRNLPGYRGRITDNAVTIAQVLKAAGYHTGMSGKWHVSNTIEQKDPKAQLDWLNHQTTNPYFSPIDQYPTHKGFEKYFGTIWGVVDYFDPFSLVSGTTPITSVPKNYYHTDAINDTAASYIHEFAKDAQPFFLYVAENAPHWPLQALPEDIAKYKDTYTVGWDAIREARYARMAKLGIIDTAQTKLSARIKSELQWKDNPDKEWDARAMAVHAAMIDRMDQGIGRIIQALKETNQLDNTLIIFLSDNGASPENSAAYGPGFDRPGQTRTGEKISFSLNKDTMPGPQNTYYSIGERWANVANTPYRLAKADSYEGGVHTPMVAFWPKNIKAGSSTARLGHVMDFMSTFTELAGAVYPKVYQDCPITPTQGLSLVSAFENKPGQKDEVLFNEHFGARYVRKNQWKLVAGSNETSWHLYNMKTDGSELTDLAAKYPKLVKELSALWQKWAINHQVFPKKAK
jgi:arylsulfatase A-like enzyme